MPNPTSPTAGTPSNSDCERLRSLLQECRDWFDSPGGEPSSSDLLDRINRELGTLGAVDGD